MVGSLLFRNCVLLTLFLTSCQIFATTTTTVTKEVEKSVNASVEAGVISQPVVTGEDCTEEAVVDTLSKLFSAEKNATIEVEVEYISQPVLPDEYWTEEDGTLSKSVSNTTVEVESLSQSVWSDQSASLGTDSYAQAVLTDQGIRYRPAHRGFSESDYGYESSSFEERGVYSNIGRGGGFDRWPYKLRDFNPAHVRRRPKGFSLRRFGPGRLPTYFEDYPPIRRLGQPTSSFQDCPPTVPQPRRPLPFTGQPPRSFDDFPPISPFPRPPRIVNRPKFVNSEFPFALPPSLVDPAFGGLGSIPPLTPTPSLPDCPDLPKYLPSFLPPVSVSPLETTGLSNYPPLCVPSTGLPGYSGPSPLLPYSYSSPVPSASDCLTLLSSLLSYGMTSSPGVSLPAPQPVLCSPSFETPPSNGLASSLETSVLITQSILC